MAVVRSIRARPRQNTGRIAITFEVDAQTWARMSRSAQDFAFFDTLDYVAGQINTALIEDAPVRPAPEARETPCDLDDGIPF